MGLFSFLKKEKKLMCSWCGKEIDEVPHVKHAQNKRLYFCSDYCKQKFRKSGRGGKSYTRCPTCAMAPKSWDK